MTLQEAAERLGVHYMTAYRYVRTGKLPAEKAGVHWMVDPADVDRLRTAPTSRRPRGSVRTEGRPSSRRGWSTVTKPAPGPSWRTR